MDASVKRHEEEHVRQVGSEDPEQRGGSDEVDKKVRIPFRYKNNFW